ncbi:alpha-L-fucosidase [Elizabethkingia meningoseptica]|uniref:alpha-L-fucosidase n=1 Tax=Elizabethkingia meningoseptica TaxID=238 RepID=UPI000332D172|nr:alpha-L-fucosidase [Elizabethkingia meningoseptica]AQX05942.1 alpha-L-fucosidase [Elizabethkingia meningoseptica]AQX47988.1 alpha-L-fucosidase [Elizabethkingia meningoseptica]EOR30080.1 alpha-L-fucosidase [Elizabethkingia meningoseptica ATCC 13253 = NBRC 12535]KUY23176.1 alpha-L-fucosidase [Elizabethkingia meningoseptica]OPB71323.1 alpha-L-fucosidase [Elizabethkingia meningoseptica]
MKNKITSLLLLSLGFSIPISAQEKKADESAKMQWFQDAKLGVFIHWGIYSVNGISESWAFFNNYINHDNYMKQLNGFNASRYNPDEWTKLIKESGAQYSVITTRHHDGISLWDSKADKAITTFKDAAAKENLIAPFVSGLKKAGIKTGLYYSLPDWSHPYYDVNTRTKKRYEIAQDPTRWKNYIRYYQTQLNELSAQYKPDLIWFDGDWEHSSAEWQAPQTLANLRKYNPNIIINSRLNNHGDYETPEQGIPVVAPQSKYWELCYTMNDSWGYQPFDRNYKTPNMIVRTLADVISMGGNLLIDIGPKADGSIPAEQVKILENLGRWTKKYSEAIYTTRQGLPFANYRGKSALSKDGKKLFLYLEETKDFTKIYGLITAPVSARIIGDTNAKVNYTQDKNGNLTLNFTNAQFDKDVTVVQLNFNEPVKYTDKIIDASTSLQAQLENSNAKDAAYEIASQLHKGNNLLAQSGITPDGMDMKIKTSSKTNPEVLNWISKNAEALYDTGAGLPNGHYSGMSALSKDRQTLYLFVEGTPTGPIALKGLKNNISRIRIAGEGSIIPHHIYNKLYWSAVPGIVYIDVPKERLDKNLTVIAVLLDKPVELYREKIGAVESNL